MNQEKVKSFFFFFNNLRIQFSGRSACCPVYPRSWAPSSAHTDMEITAKLKELRDNRQVSVLSSRQISTAIFFFLEI